MYTCTRNNETITVYILFYLQINEIRCINNIHVCMSQKVLKFLMYIELRPSTVSIAVYMHITAMNEILGLNSMHIKNYRTFCGVS